MIGMRMGMGLGAMQNSGGGATPAVWTIDSTADGTNYVRIRCATTGQTLTAAGGAEIKLESDGEWGTSVVVPSGEVDRNIYFRGNGTGGTLTFPNPENITYLCLYNTGTAITGSVTGMPLTCLYLYNTGTAITGSITGMELTYLYLCKTGTAITGSINGMALAYLYLYGTGTAITGVPPAIGKTLSSIRILNGDSYDYPWTEQTFDLPKRTWTATTMSIDCVAAAPTPAQFNTWLLGLASVSNAGTATLALKNTPTVDDLTAAGLIGAGSGYYAMTTTLGYTLTLGE